MAAAATAGDALHANEFQANQYPFPALRSDSLPASAPGTGGGDRAGRGPGALYPSRQAATLSEQRSGSLRAMMSPAGMPHPRRSTRRSTPAAVQRAATATAEVAALQAPAGCSGPTCQPTEQGTVGTAVVGLEHPAMAGVRRAEAIAEAIGTLPRTGRCHSNTTTTSWAGYTRP